ncbi:cytoplasmic protein [Paenibacillus sp. CAA11]|uniref:TFIIB-type zinc ribbon-containing protein n=1 Tax=Paenibacillus sp. CAA11 TaxID=1532905 RepID=UPI000D371501|nr:zf-TFIIB domain-containing protein [Paenibacillus sp. CAA11]AWB46106.1 cytoplasmic protein [Paenibacillus sp. CAA11]
MNCPVCDSVRMREVEKDGVLIDVCPSCKGVWLDRGELDKLLEGIRELRPMYDEHYEQSYRERQPEYEASGQYRDDDYHRSKHHKKKKRSVLDVFGDLFD